MANNVEVRVPVPSDADSPKFKTSTGHAKYVPEKNLVVWTIKSFPVSKISNEIAALYAILWISYPDHLFYKNLLFFFCLFLMDFKALCCAGIIVTGHSAVCYAC